MSSEYQKKQVQLGVSFRPAHSRRNFVLYSEKFWTVYKRALSKSYLGIPGAFVIKFQLCLNSKKLTTTASADKGYQRISDKKNHSPTNIRASLMYLLCDVSLRALLSKLIGNSGIHFISGMCLKMTYLKIFFALFFFFTSFSKVFYYLSFKFPSQDTLKNIIRAMYFKWLISFYLWSHQYNS